MLSSTPGSLCPACQLAQSKGRPRLRKKHSRCECGRPAVEALLVQLGLPDNRFTALLPLCKRCLAIEIKQERDGW